MAKVILVSVAVLIALYFVYLVRQVVGAVVIAIFLAVALGPAVDFFQRRKLPRGLAILATYLVILLAVVGVGLLIVPPVVGEIDDFARNVPSYVSDLRKSETIREYDQRYHIIDKLQAQSEALPARLGDAAGALRSVTVGIFTALFQVVTILVMTFFLLLDGRRIANFLFRQLGEERERRARAMSSDVYGAVGGYVAGAFALATIAGVSTYLVLAVLGVEFAVPLAVLMAFFDLIPLVGASIAGVLIAVATGLSDFPTALIVWSIFFIVYQQLENNVLQPNIYRRTVALHPLLVLVAVLIGASLLGVLGALLAIPAAATIQIVVIDWWQYRGDRIAVRATTLHRPTDPPAGPAIKPA